MCSPRGHVRFTPNSDRKSGHQSRVMSALPPKADMCSALAYVCFGPIADIDRLLFDDLVGSREQRGRHGQAKSLRCLQVYDEFVFAWSLHRQIARFLAF